MRAGAVDFVGTHEYFCRFFNPPNYVAAGNRFMLNHRFLKFSSLNMKGCSPVSSCTVYLKLAP